MIPIHYFLALLAILVSLTGCSQKAPPGSRQTLTSNNTTVLVDAPAPIQSIKDSKDDIIKPDPKLPEPIEVQNNSTLELSRSNHSKNWKMILKGMDADLLYQIMTIRIKGLDIFHRDLEADMKAGRHMECFDLNHGDTQCEIEMEVATGELKLLNRKIKLWEAEKVLTESVKSIFLDFDVTKNVMKFSIVGDHARLIFENLSDEKKIQTIALSADDLYAEGLEKKGVNIDCFQQFLKSNSKNGIYTCNFWYKDSMIGEFH